MVFFAVGLYKVVGGEYRKFLAVVLAGLLINLAVLRNFDRYDLILYLPISLVVVLGLKRLRNQWMRGGLLLMTVVEYLHLLWQYV